MYIINHTQKIDFAYCIIVTNQLTMLQSLVSYLWIV